MEQISQAQLNATRVILALTDLAQVNTNPNYGYGEETLALVKAYMKELPGDTLHEISVAVHRILTKE
jgi:hypothetical protein